jgi:predicted RNA polymerase sigma factor
VDANRALERTARDSSGRLVAFLTARSRDVAGAEDALGDAFRAALETWPRTAYRSAVNTMVHVSVERSIAGRGSGSYRTTSHRAFSYANDGRRRRIIC